VSCYSDHNEDIRTKGSCDLCGGTEPEGPRIGVVQSSDLGEDWSAQRHLDRLAAQEEIDAETQRYVDYPEADHFDAADRYPL
jgi:hypothetical protein